MLNYAFGELGSLPVKCSFDFIVLQLLLFAIGFQPGGGLSMLSSHWKFVAAIYFSF